VAVVIQPHALRLPRRIPFVPTLSRTEAVWLCAAVLLFGLISLIYLLQTSSIATAGYDVQRLQQEQKEWELRNEQLSLELAKMQSLTWVDERAKQLGMQHPEHTVTLQVSLPASAQGGDDGR
jgi:cell division protein FtsL